MSDRSRELTAAQRAAMRHALGLDRKRKRYRNSYNATIGSTDLELWTELVVLGFARLIHVEGNMALFTVTDLGRATLTQER